MNAYRFLKNYPDIAKKSGVYAITNPDSKKKPDMVKVGKANVFANRFTGQEGSSYSTAYPLGFDVNYIYTVPNIGYTSFNGKVHGRVALREKQVHTALDKTPDVKRFERKNLRNTRPRKTEWFEPKKPDDILTQMVSVWSKTGGESGDVYKCTYSECKNVTQGKTKDFSLEFVETPLRRSERLHS